MAARLVERGSTGAVHVLGDGITTIGRAEDNAVVVNRDGISRHHAQVRWDGRRFILTDLGSKNGTWLNGRRLTDPAPLKPGDVLLLPCDPVLELIVEVSAETVTVRPVVPSAQHTGDPARDGNDEGTVARVTSRVDAAPPVSALPAAHAAAPSGVEGLRVDIRTAEVWVRGARVALTAKEFRFMCVLLAREGGLVSRHELAAEVWPEYNGAVADEDIGQLVYRLRRKLEADPERPRHLLTMRGLGYRLVLGP